MSVRSASSFLFTFKQGSKILKAEGLGSESEVRELLQTHMDYLAAARESLKAAHNAWEHYNATQVLPSKEPIGHFQENINRKQAEVLLCQCEIAKMEKILKEYASVKNTAKERNYKALEAVGEWTRKRHPNGTISFNGQTVKYGKLPSGETVEQFIERMLVIKRQVFEQKQKLFQESSAAR